MKRKPNHIKENDNRASSKFNDVMVMSNSKTRAQRIIERRQAELDYDRKMKRIQFRAKALDFIHWREEHEKNKIHAAHEDTSRTVKRTDNGK